MGVVEIELGFGVLRCLEERKRGNGICLVVCLV